MHVPAETVEVEAVADHDRSHARPAVGALHGDPIDIRLHDAGKGVDDLGDLGGRDVLALPAEGVADPIDEIEIAARVAAHEVAAPEPQIPRLEGIAQDLLLGGAAVGIAVEALGGLQRIDQDARDKLADLVRRALDAKAVLAAHRLLAVEVEADDPERKDGAGKWRDTADRARRLVESEEHGVALGGSVELEDMRHPKACLEVEPDVGPEPVAAA